MQKNQKGFGVIEIFFFIVVLSVIGGISWYVYSKSTGQYSGGSSTSAAESESVLGHKISRADCKKILPKVYKDDQPPDGDICYSAAIMIANENIQYVIVTPSEEFNEQARKEYDKTCTFDCGHAVNGGASSRLDFIIRANGQVEPAFPGWVGSASIAVESLTGCPLGDFEKYKNSGKFVVADGRIGIQFADEDIDYSSRFGSSCKIDMDVISFTSTDKPSLKFNRLAVEYKLSDLAVCEREDSDGQDQCYSDQAGMRGDYSICSKTLHPSLGTPSTECIQSVALRKRDVGICKNEHPNSQNQCAELVEEAQSYFSSTLITSGL